MNTESRLAPFEPEERIYLTVHFACGCIGCKPVFRHAHPEDSPRVISSHDRCKLCSQDIGYNPNRRVEGFKQR